MKNKTYRFAVAAALLLALALVFAAPVGAATTESCSGSCDHQAAIGTTHYDTLQAAVDAATGEQTITVLINVNDVALSVAAGKTITLELNGKILTGINHTENVPSQVIENRGTLTIQDTTGGGKIVSNVSCADPAYGKRRNAITNFGTLVVNSGSIVVETEFAGSNVAIDTTDGSSLTINGGTIISTKNAIRACPFGAGAISVEVNGGSITGSRGIQIQLPSTTYSTARQVSLTINGGTITSTESRYNLAIYSCSDGESMENIEITISGGTFNGNVVLTGGPKDHVEKLTITDGTFNREVFSYCTNEDMVKAAFTISGGTFSSDVSDYVAYGYHVKTNDDGTFTVTDQRTVTFVGTETTRKSVTNNTAVEEPSNPTNVGYTFAGWYLGNNVYDFATKVTEDIILTAKWNEIPKDGEAVEVNPEISVEINVDQNGVTSIETSSSKNTLVVVDEKVVTIKDVSTDVEMKVTFESVSSSEGDTVSGKISSVEVTYPESPAESEGDIKQQVIFDMKSVTGELPQIDSKKDDTVVEKVNKQEQRANVLAMITATHENLDTINNNITEVKITFKVPVSLISNSELLKAYHVKGDKVDELPKDNLKITGPEGGYYTIEITSGYGFSSYVLTEEEPKQTVSNNGGKDTGSGNYQYYPREVTADGIIDFGTSKVVKGMELPAGSSGKVTLNTKPTFAMPENGFYAFEIDAPGYNLEAKINGGLSFQIPEADLTAAGWTAKDIVLYHGTVAEDGKITWEALLTNLVKNEKGIAYYKSAINGCSPFYIGFVKDGSVVNTEVVDPITPPTDEPTDVPGEILPEIPPVDEPETPATPVPLFAVLAGLGAAVVLRRK